MVSYGRTFNPVEHINPLMVLEGGKVRPCGGAKHRVDYLEGQSSEPQLVWKRPILRI